MARRPRRRARRTASSVTTSRAAARRVSPAPFIGMVGLAATFFLYGASLLVAPWWAVLVLMVVWAAQMFLATSWWSLHPTWIPWLAGFSAVLWFVVLISGGVLLGWGPRGEA